MSDSLVTTPDFGTAERDQLLAQLPNMTFTPALDSSWCASAVVQTYLDYYAINFAKAQPSLAHGFGVLDVEGFRIASHYWLPVNANVKGTLLIVHGYYDHVGLFSKAIEFGLQQGFAVLAFDLPGHGLSSGEQVAIDSFDQYADVVNGVLSQAQALLPAPFFALGQSTGGAVLLNYLWRYEAERAAPLFQSIALCAPLILAKEWNRSGRLLYALVHHFTDRRPRKRSRNSHDPGFVRFVAEQDCLQSPTLSVRWVGAMKAWDAKIRQFPPLSLPVLVVQGDEDMTVAWRYNLSQIKRALPNAQVVMVPGAGHQLVNETEVLRTQVFNAISRYFFNS